MTDNTKRGKVGHLGLAVVTICCSVSSSGVPFDIPEAPTFVMVQEDFVSELSVQKKKTDPCDDWRAGVGDQFVHRCSLPEEPWRAEISCTRWTPRQIRLSPGFRSPHTTTRNEPHISVLNERDALQGRDQSIVEEQTCSPSATDQKPNIDGLTDIEEQPTTNSNAQMGGTSLQSVSQGPSLEPTNGQPSHTTARGVAPARDEQDGAEDRAAEDLGDGQLPEESAQEEVQMLEACSAPVAASPKVHATRSTTKAARLGRNNYT